MDLSAGPCGASPSSAACHKQIEYILHHENLQIGLFKGLLVLGVSPLGGESAPAASRLANIAAFGSTEGRFFWSGFSKGAMDDSANLARSLGGKTLEMTPLGKMMTLTPRGFQTSKLGMELWDLLSANFANGATGTAHVVLRGAGRVWSTIEEPILNRNGIFIIYH